MGPAPFLKSPRRLLLRVPLAPPASSPPDPDPSLQAPAPAPPAHRFLRPAVPQMTFMFSKRMLLTLPLSMAPGSSASSASSTSRWVRSCSGWGSQRASLSRRHRVHSGFRSPHPEPHWQNLPESQVAFEGQGSHLSRGPVPLASERGGQASLPGRNVSTVIQGHSPKYQFSPTDWSEVTNGARFANLLKTFPATCTGRPAFSNSQRFLQRFKSHTFH